MKHNTTVQSQTVLNNNIAEISQCWSPVKYYRLLALAAALAQELARHRKIKSFFINILVFIAYSYQHPSLYSTFLTICVNHIGLQYASICIRPPNSRSDRDSAVRIEGLRWPWVKFWNLEMVHDLVRPGNQKLKNNLALAEIETLMNIIKYAH